MEEPCPLCKGSGRLLKLSYLEGLIRNEILRFHSENGINDFFIEVNKTYEDMIKGDMLSFLKEIDGLDKGIYLNYIDEVEGYTLEPLIFKNQKANCSKCYIISWKYVSCSN